MIFLSKKCIIKDKIIIILCISGIRIMLKDTILAVITGLYDNSKRFKSKVGKKYSKES